MLTREDTRVILAVCGPPGSGKTTIATHVHERLQTTDVELDTPIRLVHSDDYGRHAYDQMYETVMDSKAHFVLDGTFYKAEHQAPFLDLHDIYFVRVRASFDTCLRRDHERDGIGDKAVRIIHSEFHEPPVDFVLDTDILTVEAAVKLLTDRTRDWLEAT